MPGSNGLAEHLARSYSALARGLYFPGSEADSPFRPFSADLEPGATLSVDKFRGAAKLASWWDVDLRPADQWFAAIIDGARREGANPDDATRYEHLQRAMKATLTGGLRRSTARIDLYTAPYRNTRHYVYGRVADGGLAGLVAYSVET